MLLQEELPSLSRAPFGRDADPRFVEAMGGDKLLQEVAAFRWVALVCGEAFGAMGPWVSL